MRAPLARAQHFVHVGRGVGAIEQGIVHERAVAEDGGQQVVEVVRDATGKVANRFHLLRLPQLLLEAMALGRLLDDHLEHGPIHRPGTSMTRPLSRTRMVSPFFFCQIAS